MRKDLEHRLLESGAWIDEEINRRAMTDPDCPPIITGKDLAGIKVLTPEEFSEKYTRARLRSETAEAETES